MVIIVVGLVILVVAGVVAVAGVLGNGGSGHELSHPFAVFGYHVTGSTETLFLYGVVVGAVVVFGLSVLLSGARRSSRLGSAARRDLRASRRETAAVSQDRDGLIERRGAAGRTRRLTCDTTVRTAVSAMAPLRTVVAATCSGVVATEGRLSPSRHPTIKIGH
jgi:hypothetical protein